jgi:hypothetical protein
MRRAAHRRQDRTTHADERNQQGRDDRPEGHRGEACCLQEAEDSRELLVRAEALRERLSSDLDERVPGAEREPGDEGGCRHRPSRDEGRTGAGKRAPTTDRK